MTNHECRCGRPIRDNANLCDPCTDRLEETLGDVPALTEELDVTLTRQRAAGTTGPRGGEGGALPWHEKAAEAKRTLHGLLVSWVRLCHEESLGPDAEVLPTDRAESLSRWLLLRTHHLARHAAGPDALDEIADACAEGWRVVFWKRRARTYLGTCGHRVTDAHGVTLLDSCPGEIYADPGAAVGYCDDCEQGVTVVVRQAELNVQLDDRLCTAAELARLAVILGLDVPRDRVRKKIHYWHRHKRIHRRGDDEQGSPMFRYGDVRAMLYTEFATTSA